jgi:mannonate dehydratase
VPVAGEYKVRLACHPQDPGMARGRGFQGVETVLGTVDGLNALRQHRREPVSRPQFLPGHRRRDAEKPGEQIFDVIRWFGSRKKIFNVHFRNIRGRFLDFQETFIDDGDVDMLKAMRVYKEVGYDGMMMPDHVPRIEGDASEAQGFAFAFGYIKALIAAVAAE